MRQGGKILSKALGAAAAMAKPGVRLCDIDAEAERVLRENGATPSFKGFRGSSAEDPFPSTLCLSVNDEIVHGIGTRKLALKDGDVLKLDIGCWYKELCTDMAVTVPVGKTTKEVEQLLRVTRQSLMNGVKAASYGKYVSDISRAVEETVKPYGYGIIRSLVGHGVGHKVHEAPHVPNFTSDQYADAELVNGMCLAIEPMVALGDWPVETAEDGWAVVIADGSVGAHFEVTIAITDDGTEILTPLPI